MNITALILLAALVLPAAGLWGDLLPSQAVRARAVLGYAVAILGLSWLLASRAPALTGWWTELATALVMATAVVVGGPVTTSVLRLADPATASGSTRVAGAPTAPPGLADPRVLRGGAWIGALERVAVTGAVLAGWPEGIALVVAVKGLGRYPELRAPAAAERFIVGTLTSVLWAVGVAGVGSSLVH